MNNRIRAQRKKLDLTQQAFASLLGFSFVSVSRWENGHSQPEGLTTVIFTLLDSALNLHSPERVVRALRKAQGKFVDVVRTLVKLEEKGER